jgi:hypothetical protein
MYASRDFLVGAHMREILLGTAATAMVGSGVYYTMERGEIYNKPVSEVVFMLENMEIPQELRASFESLPGADISVVRKGNESVTWTFSVEGLDLAIFTAHLKEKGPKQTLVSIEFVMPDHEIAEVAKKTPYGTPLVKALAEIAMAEQVDATIEKRKFNEKKVANAAMLYVATHPAEVAAFSVSMQKFQSGADPELFADMERAVENEPAFAAMQRDAAIGHHSGDHYRESNARYDRDDAESAAQDAADAADAAASASEDAQRDSSAAIDRSNKAGDVLDTAQ